MNKPPAERPTFRCHFCDFRAESKYARKGHEKVCKLNPASKARPRDLAPAQPPEPPVSPWWDRNRQLRADHRNGHSQGFVEPYVNTSYREILLNGERS